MTYTDYRTGKPISREAYIANGLERGELVGKENCGCVVIQDRTADAYIVYCPKHEAAPDMYEALKAIYSYDLDFPPTIINQGWQALAKVEEKGGNQ